MMNKFINGSKVYQFLFSFLFFIAIFFVGSSISVSSAKAANQCFCYTELRVTPEISAKDLSDPLKFDANCIENAPEQCKIGLPNTGSPYTNCSYVTSTPEQCAAERRTWIAGRDLFISNLVKQGQEKVSEQKRKGLIGAILPTCVFEDSVEGDCRDISIFIKLAIDISTVLLSIIGSLALGVFIYGGFTLIISEGNAEKIKKGTGAIVSAVIGLAVVFGAFLLVKFLGDAIGIGDSFNLLK
jgi:hypothetical protein